VNVWLFLTSYRSRNLLESGYLPFLALPSLIVAMVGEDWSRPQSDIPSDPVKGGSAAEQDVHVFLTHYLYHQKVDD
jgi:hypothetical protein